MKQEIIEACRKVKAVFLDMDGTLCDGESMVPATFPRLVEALERRGVTVGIASGRSKPMLEKAIGPISRNMMMICSNGAVISDHGEVFYRSEIKRETAKAVLQGLKRYNRKDMFVLLLCENHTITDLESPEILDKLNQIGFEAVYERDLEAGADHVNAIAVSGNLPEDLSSSMDWETLGLTFVTSGYQDSDIFVKGVSKGEGIHQVCTRMGICPGEIMAMGDAENDLELLKTVGFPVAMKNAVPEVKALGKYETAETNAEYGAIRFLIRAFALEELYDLLPEREGV